jgi:hypothetical protein
LVWGNGKLLQHFAKKELSIKTYLSTVIRLYARTSNILQSIHNQFLSLVRLPIPPLSQVQDLKPVYREVVTRPELLGARPSPRFCFCG